MASGQGQQHDQTTRATSVTVWNVGIKDAWSLFSARGNKAHHQELKPKEQASQTPTEPSPIAANAGLDTQWSWKHSCCLLEFQTSLEALCDSFKFSCVPCILSHSMSRLILVYLSEPDNSGRTWNSIHPGHWVGCDLHPHKSPRAAHALFNSPQS